jgi:hypothetical protein
VLRAPIPMRFCMLKQPMSSMSLPIIKNNPKTWQNAYINI